MERRYALIRFMSEKVRLFVHDEPGMVTINFTKLQNTGHKPKILGFSRKKGQNTEDVPLYEFP